MRPEIQSARGVVVFRAGAVGDTILAFPALGALRAALPVGARITLVGNAALAGLAVAAGLVDEVVSFDSPWVCALFAADAPRDQEAGARLAGCDLAIVWQRDPAGPLALGLRARGVPTLSLPSLPPPGARLHVADHLRATLAPYLPAIDHSHPSQPPLPAGEGRSRTPSVPIFAREATSRAPVAPPFPRGEGGTGGMGSPRVLLHPGSGGARKNWPAERFAAVADALAERGVATALLAGPADRAAADATLRSLRRAEPLVVEPPTLDALADLLGGCDAYLGNDSGVSHLAAWLGVPTVAIFGPTDPAIWSPRGPNVRVLTGGVACAPCGDVCAERRCLRAVSVEDALAAVWAMLPSKPEA